MDDVARDLARERLRADLKSAIPQGKLAEHWINIGWSDEFIACRLGVEVARVSKFRSAVEQRDAKVAR